MYDELKFKMTSEKVIRQLKVKILPVGNNVILNNIKIKSVDFRSCNIQY